MIPSERNIHKLGSELGSEFLKIRSKLPDGDVSKLVLSKPITHNDNVLYLDNDVLLNEFRFVTAVASFAQNLRTKGGDTALSYEKILEFANPSVGPGQDNLGYRREFINLVMIAQRIQKNQLAYK